MAKNRVWKYDLLPLALDDEWIESVRDTLPELPHEKRDRYQQAFGLSEYDASVLVANKALAHYFESALDNTQAPAKLVTNWVMGDLSGALNKASLDISESPVSAEQLAGLLDRIHDDTISSKIAKTVFEAMWNGEGDANAIIAAKGLQQVTDTGAIETIIDDVMAANPTQLEQYRSGKDKLFGFFVGQVMKQTQGKANPQQVNDLLKKKLSSWDDFGMLHELDS